MKKSFRKVFLLMAVVVTAMVCLAFSASADTYGDYEYWFLDDGTVEIIDYYGNATELVVPSEIEGKRVTGIMRRAFRDCDELTVLTIPEGIENIDDYVISECENLERVILPDSIKSIGKYVFESCCEPVVIHCNKNSYAASYLNESDFDYIRLVYIDGTDEESIYSGSFENFSWSLDKRTGVLELNGSGAIPDFSVENIPWADYYCYITELKLPETLTGVGGYAFCQLDRIRTLTIPDSVTTIGEYSFCGCDNLVEVNNSANLIDIGEFSFFCCYNLKTIDIPDGVSYIGSGAFGSCGKLEQVNIPDSLTFIAPSVFSECDSLESVIIPERVENIGRHAFFSCNNIKSVSIPESVTYIDDSAFEFCTKLAEITIPDKVTCIDNRAFFGCTSLKSVKIGSGVTAIGKYAFKGCEGLSEVIIPDSVTKIGIEAFADCSSLKNVKISDYLVHINISLFDNCDSLESITIPHRVKSIEGSAFYDCDAFNEIVVYSYDCEFSIYCGLDSSHIIYGYSGSTAEYFADEIDATFIKLETEHAHEYEFVETISSTCTEAGKTINECYCGKKNIIEIPKLPHTDETVPAKAATCTETGLTEGEKCSVCGTVTLAQKTVAKKAHNYKAATCTAPKICKVCEATSGNALGHKYSNACDKTCNNCDKTREVPAHKYSNSCDKTCNECGAKRSIKHTYTNSCDKSCNVCKATRSIAHSYKTTITKATLSKNGKRTYKCSVCGATKTTTIYSPKTIKLSYTETTYNGKVKSPTVTVKDSKGNTLKKDTDYTVKYASGRKNPGKYTVTVTFKGKYEGTKKLTLTIKPKAPSISSITSNTKGKAVVKWSNVTGESGYQLYCSTSKTGEFKKVNSYAADKTAGSKTKLKSKKTYYFKVRAYKKTSSGTVYSAWSAVKSVKIK